MLNRKQQQDSAYQTICHQPTITILKESFSWHLRTSTDIMVSRIKSQLLVYYQQLL
jgi:hypothetical protein